MSSSLIDANPILVDIIDHCVAPPCKYRWNGLLIAIPQKTWLINVYVWFRGISYEYICFAPKIKRKGYRQNESPIIKTKAEQSFCYAPIEESGCIFWLWNFADFRCRRDRWQSNARILHIPGCICRFALGFCKNIKKRTETLYQSFSPFMAPPMGIEPMILPWEGNVLTAWPWRQISLSAEIWLGN